MPARTISIEEIIVASQTEAGSDSGAPERRRAMERIVQEQVSKLTEAQAIRSVTAILRQLHGPPPPHDYLVWDSKLSSPDKLTGNHLLLAHYLKCGAWEAVRSAPDTG